MYKVVVTLFTEYLHRVGALIGVVHNGCDVGRVWRAWESPLDMCEHARGGHKCRIRRDVPESVQPCAEVRVCGRHRSLFSVRVKKNAQQSAPLGQGIR